MYVQKYFQFLRISGGTSLWKENRGLMNCLLHPIWMWFLFVDNYENCVFQNISQSTYARTFSRLISNGIGGITLFNDTTRDSIPNNFVIGVYCRYL